MLIEQIYIVGPETPQRTFDGLTDVGRPAVDPVNALVAEREAEFGGDHDGIAGNAKLLECASEQLLVRVRAVGLGGVEEGHSELEGALNCRDRLVLVTF